MMVFFVARKRAEKGRERGCEIIIYDVLINENERIINPFVNNKIMKYITSSFFMLPVATWLTCVHDGLTAYLFISASKR